MSVGAAGLRRTIVPATLFAGLLLLFALTATRTIQGGDTAELTLLAVRGGVAHPPGYPLWTILGRVAAHLPAGPLPWRVAMLSAACVAGAAAAVSLAAERLAGDRPAAIGAALLAALALPVWRVAGLPEVFGLAALLAALVMALSFAFADAPPSSPRAYLLAAACGLACGLGLSNHLTAVFLAPLPLVALGARFRAEARPAAALRACALFLAGLLAGLLPYALLPFLARHAAPGAFVWGDPTSWRGFLDHVLRRQYGTFQLGVGAASQSPWQGIGRMARAIAAGPSILLLLAAIPGGWMLARRARAMSVALGLSLLLAAVVFPARFNLPEGALASQVEERFAVLPLILLVPFAAAGFALLRAHAARAFPIALAGGVLVALVATRPHADWSRDPTVERWLAAAVQNTAPDAVIVGIGDVCPTGVPWVTRVRGVRPDVTYVDLNLVRQRWYYDRLGAMMSGVPFDAKTTRLRDLLDGIAPGRPVYVVPWAAALVAGSHPVHPEGLLVRVERAGDVAPSIDDELASLMRAQRDFEGDPPGLPRDPVDAWSADLRRADALVWSRLAADLQTAGRPEAALRARAVATSMLSGARDAAGAVE